MSRLARLLALGLLTVAVSLALTVALARANGGPSPPTRLDKATASVIAWDIAGNTEASGFSNQEIQRCIRIGALRVDCIFEEVFFDMAYVVAIRVIGERIYFTSYRTQLRGYYSKANSIRISPRGSRMVLIQESYYDLR
jgi:hypothetical protein